MNNLRSFKYLRIYDVISIILLSFWVNQLDDFEFKFTPSILIAIGKYVFSIFTIISFFLYVSELRESFLEVKNSIVNDIEEAYSNTLDSKENELLDFEIYIILGFAIYLVFVIVSYLW